MCEKKRRAKLLAKGENRKATSTEQCSRILQYNRTRELNWKGRTQNYPTVTFCLSAESLSALSWVLSALFEQQNTLWDVRTYVLIYRWDFAIPRNVHSFLLPPPSLTFSMRCSANAAVLLGEGRRGHRQEEANLRFFFFGSEVRVQCCCLGDQSSLF